MRMTMTVILAALTVALAVPAFAELQNVEVGGSIRIRGSYYTPEGVGGSFIDQGNSLKFVEQRTRLNVKADFTDDVSAFIELDSWDVWGEDFRSNYITGADTRAASGNDIEMYQGYIETRETFGMPLTIRIGRQEILLGSEWLIGNNDTSSFFRGLSFDGVTARYEADSFSVTALFAKLAEVGNREEDGDTDLWGVYASYTGIDDVTIDLYWLFLDDGAAPTKVTPRRPELFSNLGLDLLDDFEALFGVDQFDDTTTIHTIGLRGAGTISNFDFEAEFAYQFGDATSAVSGFFNPDPASVLPFVYGDDDEEYDAWAMNLEVGYTFDVSYQPRLYLGFAYFEGEDEREDDLGDLIRSLLPYSASGASVGFNRMFSDWEYTEILGATDLSNVLIFRGGASVQPTEDIEVRLDVTYLEADEETSTNGILFGLPLFNRDNDDDIGWEIDLYITYNYSEDLTFEVGYAHFFADDGAEDGNFINGNGLFFTGGPNFLFQLFGQPPRADDDADYIYFETSLAF